MAKKKGRRFGKASRPSMLLSNAIASQALSDSDYRQAVANFFVLEPDTTLESSIRQLIKHRRFAEQLTANATTIEQFGSKAFQILGLPSKRLWRVYRFFLKINADKISRFATFRDEIERSILIGDYVAADRLLSQAKELFGESMWYVRTRMLTLLGQERSEEFRSYCEECKTRAGESLTSYIFKCFQLITDSDNPEIILQSLIFRTTNEFKEAQYNAVASLLETLFVPYPLKGRYNYLNCLSRLQFLTIIDQYTVLTSILRMAVADSKGAEIPVIESLGEILTDLSSAICDPYLQQIANAYFTDISNCTSKQGTVLLKNYEEGNYSAVISGFETVKDQIANPLAYINLVAKATAQLGLPSDVTPSGNLLQKLTSHLSTIYSLGPLWAQAEEAIVSVAIKYHYFRCSPHIQLSLYKALPNRYASSAPAHAAALAIATDLEATPLTFAMNRFEKVAFGLRVGTQSQNVPVYRQIKRDTVSAIVRADESYNFEESFRRLEQLAPLKKDYIETFAEYCLHTNQEEKLISAAAHLLVGEFNHYVCFPLEQLVRVIEENRLSKVEAVVTAYFYNRYVFQDRDYVLHESFEEFLLSQNARKPSDILSNKAHLTPIEALFFRDICSPEVMDFLSCFTNTNELRTERVRILDLLLEFNVVGTDARMREVEEIVGRVIIDAGTSDFNGAKITVDEKSIKKKHVGEIKALLALYKQARDTGEDRFTVLREDSPANGIMEGYVSGNKNSAVLKMHKVLSEAFQYDEKYGLDKNLSAEIRHGFFSNLMRARLQEWKLITEVDELGNYKENCHWRELNALLKPAFWEQIDTHLKTFSARFNELIAEAEEWMKIAQTPEQRSRVFTFLFEKEEFEATKRLVETTTDPEKVASYVLSNMWEKTEACLTRIRDKLNGEFRDRVDALFEQLETNIRDSKRSVALLELTNAIGHARNEIKEDITIAAEWFRRTENAQTQTRTLDYVIEIAINSFEQVKGGTSAITKNIPIDLRSIEIPGAEVKPFLIAIINLLDNCYGRSGLGYATQVEVSGGLSANGAQIAIKNNLSLEKARLLTEELLHSINSKIHSPETLTLVRSEGGSGLIKAYNEISSSAPKSDLYVSRKDEYFSAVIYYEP